jgi:hypothetical protein
MYAYGNCERILPAGCSNLSPISDLVTRILARNIHGPSQHPLFESQSHIQLEART